MKNINVLKLFLVTILAVVWIVAIDDCVNAVVKKEGHEEFVETMYATPDCLKVGVWDQEQTDPYKNYQKLVERYEGQEGIVCVSPSHDWLDFSSVELEETTGRSVYLEGRVYEEMIVRALSGEAPEELQEYEVLIPKYFTPCGIGGYQGKSYTDGDEWIGKSITVDECAVSLKVVGTFDNIKIGVEGNQIFYSLDTFKKLAELVNVTKKPENYVDTTYDWIDIYVTDARVKERLNEELEEEYGADDVTDTNVHIDVSVWEQDAYNVAVDLRNIAVVGAILTIVVLLLSILLLKKEIGIRRAFGCECLVAALGLILGVIQNYKYVKEENALLQADPGDFHRMLQYPMQPLYYAAAIAVVLIVAGAVLILVKKRRGTGEE